MRYNEYEYEYHDIAEDADYIDQDDDIYYDDGTDEPWIDVDQDDNDTQSIEDEYEDRISKYDSYYHDIADEIDD